MILLIPKVNTPEKLNRRPGVSIHVDRILLIYRWLSPAAFTSSCRLHSEFFPLDGQSCQLKFGSWTLNSNRLILVKDSHNFYGEGYIPSPEWELVEGLANHHSICYHGYGDIPYDDITYTVKMYRKGIRFSSINMIS